MEDEDIDLIEEVSSVVKPKKDSKPKKCFICETRKAEFVIKGTTDFYCKDCAEDAFGDLDLLEKL